MGHDVAKVKKHLMNPLLVVPLETRDKHREDKSSALRLLVVALFTSASVITDRCSRFLSLRTSGLLLTPGFRKSKRLHL